MKTIHYVAATSLGTYPEDDVHYLARATQDGPKELSEMELALAAGMLNRMPGDGQPGIDNLESRVLQWAHERGIMEHSDPKTQFAKTVSEVGELADSIAKGECIKDDVGDILVTLIILCNMRGTNLLECLQVAWEEIRGRKGEMVNGTFVKEGD